MIQVELILVVIVGILGLLLPLILRGCPLPDCNG
jgi:hypothetical protein